MVMFILVNGNVTKLIEKEFIFITMEQNMKEIGLKIDNMVIEQNLGQMVLLMKVNTNLEKNMEKVYLKGLMVVFILENFQTMKLRVLGNINGMMEENMKGNGKIIKWKVEENLNDQMVENMKVYILMIKKKGLGFLCGQMERYIKEIGNKETSMDMEQFNLMMGKKEMEFGSKENMLEIILIFKKKQKYKLNNTRVL